MNGKDENSWQLIQLALGGAFLHERYRSGQLATATNVKLFGA
jgi:hypothetical protein